MENCKLEVMEQKKFEYNGQNVDAYMAKFWVPGYYISDNPRYRHEKLPLDLVISKKDRKLLQVESKVNHMRGVLM